MYAYKVVQENREIVVNIKDKTYVVEQRVVFFFVESRDTQPFFSNGIEARILDNHQLPSYISATKSIIKSRLSDDGLASKG